MSQLSHTIRTFNRFELKYLLSLQQAEKFKSGQQAYLMPDEHGGCNGSYTLNSLYFDSPGLRCYWEKDDGLRFRRKLRIRHYDSGHVLTDDTPVFVEIKQRIDRVTQKRRVRLTYAQAVSLCYDRSLPTETEENQAVLEEIYAFIWSYNLYPMSIVSYDRQAFVGSEYDLGLRVTFDSLLKFQSHPLHLHEASSGLLMLPASQVVMEVKVNERIPYWLTELIAKHNLKMVRVSKYCRSIEAAQFMPSIHWNRLALENSQEVLSSSYTIFNTPEPMIRVK